MGRTAKRAESTYKKIPAYGIIAVQDIKQSILFAFLELDKAERHYLQLANMTIDARQKEYEMARCKGIQHAKRILHNSFDKEMTE